MLCRAFAVPAIHRSQSSRLGERQGALSRETCSLMVRPRDTEEHVLHSTTLLGMMRNRYGNANEEIPPVETFVPRGGKRKLNDTGSKLPTLMTLTRRSWTDSLSDTGCLLTRAKPTGYVGRPGVTSSSYHFPSSILVWMN